MHITWNCISGALVASSLALFGCSSTPTPAGTEPAGSTSEAVTASSVTASTPPARLPAMGAPSSMHATDVGPALPVPPGATLIPLDMVVPPLPPVVPAFIPPAGFYGPGPGPGPGPMTTGNADVAKTDVASPALVGPGAYGGPFCPPGYYYGAAASCVITPGFICPIGYSYLAAGMTCNLTPGYCPAAYFYDGYSCEANFGGYPYYPFYPGSSQYSYYSSYYGSYYGGYYGGYYGANGMTASAGASPDAVHPELGLGYPGGPGGYYGYYGYSPYYPFFGSLYPYTYGYSYYGAFPSNPYFPAYSSAYNFYGYYPYYYY